MVAIAKPQACNAGADSNTQKRQIGDSVVAFGFLLPILFVVEGNVRALLHEGARV